MGKICALGLEYGVFLLSTILQPKIPSYMHSERRRILHANVFFFVVKILPINTVNIPFTSLALRGFPHQVSQITQQSLCCFLEERGLVEVSLLGIWSRYFPCLTVENETKTETILIGSVRLSWPSHYQWPFMYLM